MPRVAGSSPVPPTLFLCLLALLCGCGDPTLANQDEGVVPPAPDGAVVLPDVPEPDMPELDAAPLPDVPPGELPRQVTFATYNVLNLFDLVDDPAVDEAEFTPGGRWNAAAYANRLERLAEAIVEIDADVIGLTEIENQEVVEALADAVRTAGGHDYAHIYATTGRDGRSIDVGVMSRYPFQRTLSRPINREFDCVNPEGPVTLDGRRPETRPMAQADIDTNRDGQADFVVLVSHWRSKIAGDFPCPDEAHRMRTALQIRELMDALIESEPTRPVISLGDFNAWEFEPPLTTALEARLDKRAVTADGIFNTWGDLDVIEGRANNSNQWNNRSNSSYYFDGWNRLDHILVSGNVVTGDSIWRFQDGSTESVSPDFMIRNGRPYQWSFSNQRGFSDHLPVKMTLERAE